MAVTDHIVVRALGVRVGIPVEDAARAARLRHQWVRALSDEPAEVMLETTPEDDYALTIQVTLLALQATAGTRLNLHAGAVADAGGRTLALVGASGSGKTTAVRVLARGLGYLSDETVSLTDDLTVHPHPKPLSVITNEAEPGRKESVSPDDAGLATAPPDPTLRRIVLLRRGHGTEGLVPITTTEAIVEIVPQTSSLTLLPAPLQVLASMIERCGGAFALHYDEVGDHIAELTALLSDEEVDDHTAELAALLAEAGDDSLRSSVHHPPHHLPADLPDPAPGEWARCTWLDAVQYDDQLVVMIDDTAHLLGGIGTTAWLALAEPASIDVIVDAIVAAHGEHPEARSLVEAALEELAGRGLVATQVTSGP